MKASMIITWNDNLFMRYLLLQVCMASVLICYSFQDVFVYQDFQEHAVHAVNVKWKQKMLPRSS